jgi:predicted transcriptional regulator
MRRKDDERQLAEALRAAGRTYDEIAAELGVSKSSLSLWLRDLPPPDPERGRVAMDPTAERVAYAGEVPTTTEGRRALARDLRLGGWLLREIAELLGVTVRAVHRYVADLPVPARASRAWGGDAAHMEMMRRAYWDRVLAEREAERRSVKAAAAAEIGALSRRELHLVAVTAYWAEGSKDKPWRRHERVVFTNSDEGMIRLWLAFLDDLGWPEESRRYRVNIHESADVEEATRSWAAVIGVPTDRFSPPALKRHNPTTSRHNTGEDYRGCLVVSALQARVLYQRIAGAWAGIVTGLAG